jgi:ribose 1,5-bisphosphokinase PhnN
MTRPKLAAPSLPPGSGRPSRGRLILVTCPDPARLDLVLRAAARRLAGSISSSLGSVVIAAPVVTRSLPAGTGIVVNRRTLAAFEAAGALCLSWRSGGRTLGYTAALLDQLASGAIVVAAAGREAEEPARVLWTDVRVVRLDAGTETLRGPLARKLVSVRREAGSGSERHVANALADGCDWRVRDHGDLSSAVRELTVAIEMQLPPAVRMRGVGERAAAKARADDTAPRGRVAVRPARRARAPAQSGAGRVAQPQSRAVLTT